MIESKYEKDIEKFKKHVLNRTKRELEEKEFRGQVFILYKRSEKLLMATYDINDYLENDKTKDILALLLPHIFQSVREKKKATIICFAFCSEVWKREWDLKEGLPPENYKDVPISGEALMVSFETEYSSWNIMRDIKRDGKKAIVEDPIERDVDKMEKFSGRFANLFRKYNSNNNLN